MIHNDKSIFVCEIAQQAMNFGQFREILNEIFLFSLKFHENIPAAEVGASNSSSISLLPTPNEKL